MVLCRDSPPKTPVHTIGPEAVCGAHTMIELLCGAEHDEETRLAVIEAIERLSVHYNIWVEVGNLPLRMCMPS